MGWTVLYALLYAATHLFRVLRWEALVQPISETTTPRVIRRVCAVGFAAILLLPFRLGELVRPYLLSQRSDVSVSAGLGTVVVERVIDGLVVTGMLFATLAVYSGAENAEFARTLAIASAAIFLPATVVCIAALIVREPTFALLRRVGNLVSSKLTDKILGILEAFVDGFAALAQGRSTAKFLGVTALYWTMNVVSMWVLARFGFGLDLSVADAATVLAILVVGIMIPAGPAMAGNFEYFGIKALGLFVATSGVAGVEVAAFVALIHIVQVFVIALPGFFVMWGDRGARNLIELSAAASEAQGS